MPAVIREITENTALPISLIIIVVGTVAWLTRLHALTLSNCARIAELDRKQDVFNSIMQNIDNRLNRIEGKLGARDL